MKKLVVTILGISVLGIVGNATVSGAPAATRPPEASNLTLSAEVVNNIAIPLDILLHVQAQYQGYAVTGADKVNRNGQQAYRLRVDQNDIANDSNSFYLLYDTNWKLLGEEKIVQPPQKTEPKRPEQPQQPADTPRDEQEKPQPETEDANQTQPSVGPEDGTTETSQPPTNPDDRTNSQQENQTPKPTRDDRPTNN